MNLKEIKEMISLMNEHNLMEIEIEREGNKIRIKKEAKDSFGVGSSSSDYKVEHIPAHFVSAHNKPVGSQESISLKTAEVKSPMVGTFYRSPSPEAGPFVEVGQEIEIGQVICIIEAMKLMNEIKSEVKGKIVDILVDSGEPVEFGQNLFLIEPI